MFSVITRTVANRTTAATCARSIRCMSNANVPPSKPPQDSNSNANETPSTPPPESSQTPSSENPNITPNTINVPSLDFMPEDEPQRTGARSSKDTLSSAEQQRRNMGRVTSVLLLLGFGLNVAYMGREWSAEELKEKKLTVENAPSTRLGRTQRRFMDFFDYFSKPAWTELLPPPYPPPHQKPYTLLLSVDDLLVTSTWDRQHGWRTAKRPGVDYFLAYISQFYEVVIFTSQHAYTASPILDQLDRYNFFISHRLFREATRSYNGGVVKDLSYLNRDLSKVILLDTEPSHAALHPENAIIVPKWKGDPKDRGLVDMIPFLESIAIYKPPDVRPILQAYAGKNIPIEYAKKEAEGKAKHIAEWTANKGTRSNSIGSFFGLSAHRSAESAPPTYLEQKRKEAQMQYKEEQAYIEKNKDYLEKLLKQEQDMMAAQVPKNLWEAVEQIRGGPPPPGQEGQAQAQAQIEAPQVKA